MNMYCSTWLPKRPSSPKPDMLTTRDGDDDGDDMAQAMQLSAADDEHCAAK